MIYRSVVSSLLLGVNGLAAAFEFSSFSAATLSSFSNASASTPFTKGGSTSPLYTTLTASVTPQGQSPPNSNSRGDYVTTRYTTQHPTYTLPLGFTETEAFGPSGVVLVGPTTWVTQDVLPLVEVANDLNTTSSVPQPWDPFPFFSGENKTIVTGKASFISYGREPACTSAFSSYAAANPSTTYTEKSVGTITLSNGQTTIAVGYSTATWPIDSAPHCCGTCSLYFSSLQMLYWPASHPNTACLEPKSAGLNSTGPSGVIAARDQSVYVTDSDGYVYTSPSIYVRFPTVSASDACGLVGSASTSITLAFAPGELSTFVWELYQRTSSQTFTSVLDTADLPCGPWNGTNKFLPEPWSNYSSYQPLIVLPSKLVIMVPAWKSCTADIFEGQDPPRTLSPAAAMAPTPTTADTHAQKSAASPSSIPALPTNTGAAKFQPADPDPTQNSPSKASDPSAGDSGDPNTSNAPFKSNDPPTNDPGDSSDDTSPPQLDDPSTGDSGRSSDDNLSPNPKNPSTGDPGGPKEPADSAASSAASPAPEPTRALAGDPPADSSPTTSAADNSNTVNTPPAFPPAVAIQDHTITQGAAPVTINKTPVVYQSGTISADGEIQAVPTRWGQSNGNANPVTVGGLTFSAIPSAAKAGGDPQTDNDHAANAAQINDPAANSPDLATYITVGGQTIAVEANAISIAGTTLKPGDPGITIDGTPISLGSSVIVVGSRTETLSPPQATITAQPPYITIDGQTISLGFGDIIIDGMTLKPAGPGITVDGTLVSLGSSILVVGSHTQSLILSKTTPATAPSYLTIDRETIAVAASSIVVGGHTMTPGGPAMMADGTLISLGSSVLIVGTQTTSFTLPTAVVGTSPSENIGAMIMKGLGGIGVGTVAAPTQTAGGNGTVVFFTGDAKKEDIWFKGLVAGILTVVVIVV